MFGMGRIRLFKAFGIQVEAHWTLLLALGLFAFSGSLPLALLVFASVLVHEFGHSLVAIRRGIGIAGIELHFFGGVAKMTALPRTPRDEILIAAAGPLTSLALAAIGGLLWWSTGTLIALELGFVNLTLAVFNMLPALPMDGGRIFRAALQTKLGAYRATKIAATVARGLAVALGVFGLVMGQVFLPVLAVLLWMMAGQELAYAEMRHQQRPPDGVEVLPPEGAAGAASPIQDLLAQLAARQGQSGDRRRVVMRDANGRIVVIEEGAFRW